MKNKRMVFIFFLSYVLLVTPMLGVSYLVTHFTLMDMKEQVDERMQEKSIKIVMELEEQLIAYRDSAVKISNIDQLSIDKMTSHSHDTSVGIEYLVNILMMDGSLKDIMILYQGNLYTTSGYCRPQTYLSLTLRCDDTYLALGEEVFRDEQISTLYLRTAEYDYLLLHYPIDSNRGDSVDSVNYCIRMDTIYALLEPLLEQISVGIQIIFQNDCQTESIYLKGSMEEGIWEIDQETFVSLMEEKNWVEKTEKSELLGMELKVSYDSQELYQHVLFWRRVNEWCMGAFLLLSILVSYKISASHYQKIYQLKKSLGNVWSQKEAEGQIKWENDFDTMQTMIRLIGAETNRMKSETDNVRKMMKQQVAMLLFYGGIREESSIAGMMDSCGVELQEPFFTVACIVSDDKNGTLPSSIDELVQENLGCISSLEGRKAALVLFELPNEDFVKKYRSMLAQKILQEMGGDNKVKIAFSQTYENLQRAPGAYLEAAGICQKLLHTGEQYVGYMDTVIDVKEQTIRFEEGTLERFENAVIRGELQLAQNGLNVLLDYMHRREFSEENIKYLRYCIIQSLTLCLKNPDEYEDTELLEDIAGIDITCDEEFESKIRDILRRVCQQEEKEQKVHFSRIVEYINSNYHRYDLSLEDVAEYAGLSKAYMSRLFKEKTGSRYIEYLTRCRMENAKKLLEETDLGIKEIAAMVGYCNVPGFRNKFKEYYGVNASEYRRAHRG